MVNLAPYFRSYQFEHGLRMLETGYIAARDSLEEEIKRIEHDSAAYDLAVANGADLIAEYDEDGVRLWEQSQVYEAQITDVYSALFEVRKAFVIALYHFWEDSAAHWMALNGKQASHEDMELYCSREGYGPSPDLGAVRCLANHLKHGRNSRTDWLARLRSEYPSFLPPQQSKIFGFSEETLFKVAAVIFASGPTTAT
ncbi:hypothetical protein EPK99_15640 [Neorhizobium lilium]|uniref:Uncharacterized protein n=1 Tax=Neorhizobium lilium TaxID=2503024 RepID=A0A3S3VHZ4_9HYPH|nr:hypothetical protein [Neorhizobium lilium]RWX77086.1 hypothetical protein EPK99_15640 [Neorhizobium lilium]